MGRYKIAVAFLLLAGTLVAQTDAPRLRPLPSVSKNVVTGPEIGKKIPNFRLSDQTGRMRDFRTLTGRKGLLLAFVRSADW